MIGFAVKVVVGGVVSAGMLYTLFFVPLGRRTLFEHLSRIAATDEARELGEGVETTADELTTDVRERVVGDP